MFPLDAAYKKINSGGVYCSVHADQLFPEEERILISKLARKISFRS